MPHTVPHSQSAVLTSRGLERRVKRHFNNATLNFAAITIPGFEIFAARELEQLQPGCVKTHSRGIIEFTGTLEHLYRVHLHCRTVNRILMRITSFTARSYPELYNKTRRISWEIYIGFNRKVHISVSSTASRLHHTDNIADSALEGVNASLSAMSLSVNNDSSAPVSVFIRFDNDTCSVSIDASGDLLYKRGTRPLTGRAPLRETTAATLLMAAQWKSYPVIADPFCGSGAIVCEAALMASHAAPGLYRNFAFSTWPSFKQGLWDRLKSKAETETVASQIPVVANDVDTDAVNTLEKNLALLPVPIHPATSCGNAFSLPLAEKYGSEGLIISNLPFGKRIVSDSTDMETFYRKLGIWLKRSCKGWHFAFLVADPKFECKAGIRGKTLLSFSNGGIKVRLVGGNV